MFSVAIILILGVVFVNGFTDAANAVATTVGSKALNINNACFMSAVMNFVGVFTASIFNATVADSLFDMIMMSKGDRNAILVIIVSMLTVLSCSIIAWYFGIPTSESHALIAGLIGCSVATNASFDSVNKTAIFRIICGMLFSVFLGFVASSAIMKFLPKNNKLNTKRWQIACAALLSIFHGAQDGQKFLGVFMLLFSAADISAFVEYRNICILLCSLVMSLGTAIGGKRIILCLGEKITPLSGWQGLVSDIATIIGLAVSTFSGIPVSTTHIKTASVVGVGLSSEYRKLDIQMISDIVVTWVLTFPGCGLLGYLMFKLFNCLM